MKKQFQLITGILCCLLLLVTSTANAHPGRTDSNGGHTCWTNCEKWGYEYGEYHYHNGGNSGGSKSNSNNNEGDSSSSNSTPKPKENTQKSAPAKEPSQPKTKSKPKPQIDKKQVQADQHYQNALDLYNSANYKDAINELEKIYVLKKSNNKTDELVKQSVEAIYKLAETARNKENYASAKDHLTYIQDYSRATDGIKEKANKLLKQTKLDEKISKVTSSALNLMEKEDYEEAINELEKVYEWKETDVKTDELIQESVEAIYSLAKTARNKEDYQSTKEHLIYIQDYERTSDDIKEKATKLLKKTKSDEKISKIISGAEKLIKKEDYEDAIIELEKVYEWKETEAKADELVQKSVEAIYSLANTALNKEDYQSARDHLTYILEYERTSDDVKEKAIKLQEQIKINEEVSELISNAKDSLDKEDFESAIKYIQNAQEISDGKEIESIYKEIIESLMDYAKKTSENKQYAKAIPAFELLVENTTSKKLNEQYQSKLHRLQEEQLIQESFGLDTDNFKKDSFFKHLMQEENETPYNKNVEKTLKSAIADKTDENFKFIFSIQLDELFKGGQNDAS